MVQGLNPSGCEFSLPVQTALGPTQPPVQWVVSLLPALPGVKWPVHGIDQPPSSSTKVKKKSGPIHVLPLWVCMAVGG